MSPIIQIEGPDGSGKSFLSNKIVDVYKAAYIHVSNYADKDVTMNQHKPMIDFGELWAHKQGFSPVVFDRHWLTLFVYSMIFDSKEDQTKVMRMLELNLPKWLKIVDKIVFCLPPKQVYLERFEKIKESRAELYSDMEKVYDAFWSLYTGTKIDNPVCNTPLWQYLVTCSFGGMKNRHDVMLYDYTQHLNEDPNEFIMYMDKNLIYGE